jgi:hypothetical protein
MCADGRSKVLHGITDFKSVAALAKDVGFDQRDCRSRAVSGFRHEYMIRPRSDRISGCREISDSNRFDCAARVAIAALFLG